MKLDIKDFDSETAYHIMEKLCKEYSPRVSGSKKEQFLFTKGEFEELLDKYSNDNYKTIKP